jgi:hypothetical protein
LIDAPDAFQVAHVVGVLASQIARMLGLDLAVGLFLLARLLQRAQLSDTPLSANIR